MLSALRYSVFIVLIISIIIGDELSLSKAEANNKLVGCAFNNNNGNESLECQETFPVAQAQSWRERRWRNNDHTDMIIMIVIVVAILVFLVGCILPYTKCCGSNDGRCWKEMDRANDYRTYFPIRIPAAESSAIKEDGDNNLNTVSDADSNKEIQLQPSISIN
ncbi:unnamed protein product [Orchesella dallaii]|uniref:Uncharacterized protein n=1 Tax=Orchesella dallaii TaxID=48710 RepID=A0ABP1S7Z0_9HEXA